MRVTRPRSWRRARGASRSCRRGGGRGAWGVPFRRWAPRRGGLSKCGGGQNWRSRGPRMSEQRTGKVTAEIFEQVILRRLGARDPGVVVGPAHGVDVGVVRGAPGPGMALTSDPVFIVPAYGWV